MKVEKGFRKFFAFIICITAFCFTSLSVLVFDVAFNKQFSISDYVSLFVPLGSGISAISLLFFTANTAEHFAVRHQNIKEDEK